MANDVHMADREIAICWFRRDLRLEDNHALDQALASGFPVLPLFIVDTEIVDELQEDDARFSFIYEQLRDIHATLSKRGSGLLVVKGNPVEVWKELAAQHSIKGVYANKDYEPYARNRDAAVHKNLAELGIPFHLFKDQVIFEEGEVLKDDGTPYTVFTPYKRKWLQALQEEGLPDPKGERQGSFLEHAAKFPERQQLGFIRSEIQVAPYDLSQLPDYPRLRDLPARDATSRLSPHLRFGTVSIRSLVRRMGLAHETFLSELIWREFFMQILFHFPRVVDQNFHRKYDGIPWRNQEDEFERWCQGQTGFPMVDAGMRQLNQTGFMHNRVRMVTASFLCKHLLIDWRWGEAYFASRLLDYELSSNNGNWQWAAGTGCDAAPYFRVFNPSEQLRKFDPDLDYVRRWASEYGSPSYPEPMVDHKFARERAISAYKQALQS